MYTYGNQHSHRITPGTARQNCLYFLRKSTLLVRFAVLRRTAMMCSLGLLKYLRGGTHNDGDVQLRARALLRIGSAYQHENRGRPPYLCFRQIPCAPIHIAKTLVPSSSVPGPPTDGVAKTRWPSSVAVACTVLVTFFVAFGTRDDECSIGVSVALPCFDFVVSSQVSQPYERFENSVSLLRKARPTSRGMPSAVNVEATPTLGVGNRSDVCHRLRLSTVVVVGDVPVEVPPS